MAELIESHGLKAVRLSNKGATVECILFGATIVSFKPAGGKEMLFVSKNAVFDGKKAIRGGIPLVFPQFGTSDKLKLPQHGFARNSNWEWDGSVSEDGGLKSVVLTLRDYPETQAVFPHSFIMKYTISLGSNKLVTELSAQNTGAVPFPCQMLLHTYFRANGEARVAVHGLDGVRLIDKMRNAEEFTEASGPTGVTLTAETDRIYVAAPDELVLMTGFELDPVKICKSARLTRALPAANAAGTELKSDVVVWNPWIAKSKAMADFGDEEWHEMVCVEPGVVSDWVELAPAATLSLSQSITVGAGDAQAAAAARL